MNSSSRIIDAINKIALPDRLSVINGTNLTDMSPTNSTTRLIQGRQFSLGEVCFFIAAAASMISICILTIYILKKREPANRVDMLDRESKMVELTSVSDKRVEIMPRLQRFYYTRRNKYSEQNKKITKDTTLEEFLKGIPGEENSTGNQSQRGRGV